MLRRILLFASALVLASCQSAPPPPAPSPKPSPTRPVDVGPLPPAAIERPASFRELPNWDVAPIELPLSAFKRSCVKLQDRSAGDFMANVAPWAGYVAEWLPACDAVNDAQDDESARRILESLFTPVEISDPSGKSRFTGYFEPLYEARYTPTPPFTEPVPALPADLVPNGASPKQRLRNGALRPYPSRAEITTSGVSAIAYAHPADVFFLQIQCSGRLQFPDGRTVRAAYAAHNGHPFRSTANWLMETGRITAGEASMQGIRAWMDRAGPVETRMAMNQNPRFVFFRALPEGDAALGPEGAQAVPLTPLSSMAVDTDIHPLGVPMYVQTTAPGLGGDWAGMLVAQDTGGAIKGAVRGDLYFGTGPEAGERAGTMNAPGRLWVFLPKGVAARIHTSDMATLGFHAGAP